MPAKTYQAIHKVRGYECDFYGHVNNAVYLNYLEYARGELLNEAGLSLTRLKTGGYIIIIREVHITYLYPARIHDTLRIRTQVSDCHKVKCTFHQEITRVGDSRRIADAHVTWVVINEEGKPVRIPAMIREALSI